MPLRKLLFASLFLLPACSSALISSGQTDSASQALSHLRIVSQSAEIGAFSTARSFDQAAPYYARAIAGFEAATPAAGQPGDDPRAEERAGIRKAMANCIESIKLTAKLHKSEGLTSNPDDFFALQTCESATRSMGRSV